MKKFLVIVTLISAITFGSCTYSTESTTETTDSVKVENVDTTVVDSMVVDTLTADTLNGKLSTKTKMHTLGVLILQLLKRLKPNPYKIETLTRHSPGSNPGWRTNKLRAGDP